MGHLLTTPLRSVASLAEAGLLASALFEADAVPPFTPVFFQASFGPIAVYPSGQVRQAEIIAEPGTGYPKVVAL